MTELPPIALLDAALRGALVAKLLLLAMRWSCDGPPGPAARTGVALMVGLSVQALASLPWIEAQAPQPWQAPLIGISVGNSVLFWLYARTLFDDRFLPDWRHVAVWVAVVTLGVVFFQAVVVPQRRLLEPPALAVAIAMRWTPLLFAVLAIRAAAMGWSADLVERRRRLRRFVVIGGSLYTVVTAAARLLSGDGRLSPAMALLDTAMLVLIVGVLSARVLRLEAGDLIALRPGPLPGPMPAAPTSAAAALAGQSPVPPPAAADPADLRLAAELDRQMTQERAYRSEDLTVASLAARLGAPEYRLRRVINQGLGYRNFSAYVNGFRLDDARRALADPAQREVPVLTIALDAGFQSIGPFNRAFKADTGLTPSEFRRQVLADS